jgi:DNA-directed RNA polymerase sigma subunit (sigma70/sigma32)
MQPELQLPKVTLCTFGESELFELEDRTAHILRMRSGMMSSDVPSLREVGEELGITKERVRQLQNDGLRLIRQLREVERHLRRPAYPHHRYPWARLRTFS